MFERFKKIVGPISKVILIIIIISLLGYGKWAYSYHSLENFLMNISFSFHFLSLVFLKEALINISQNSVALNIVGMILLTFVWLFLQIYTELLSKEKTDRHILWVYLTSVFILTALIVISADIYNEWQINKLLSLGNGKSNPVELSDSMKPFSAFIDMLTKGLTWSDIIFIIVYIFGIISAVFSSSTINALSGILPGGKIRREKTEEIVDKNILQKNDSSFVSSTLENLTTKKSTQTDGEDKKVPLKKSKISVNKSNKIVPKKITSKKNTTVSNLK